MRLGRRTLPLELVVLAIVAPVIALSTAALGYATYVRLYRTILDGFDRKLAALSSTTSVYYDPDEMVQLLDRKKAIQAAGGDPEQDPSYLKYVLPMREIRQRAGLTFVYTQLLQPGDGRRCTYLVDGTVGEGHSELGAEDTIPDEDWDVALRVQHDGAPAQTGIRRWAQWGLLKCGWAPMYSRDGQVKGMAGTDVEITVIRQKTYAALLETGGVGALTLLLAGLVSVQVARRLTAPLGRVREAALRIASGDYGFRCAVDRPRELAALGDALNRLGEIMQTTIDQTRPRLAAWRRHRGAQALLEALALRPYRSTELGIAVEGTHDASGYAVDKDAAVVWIGQAFDDELVARKRARDIERVARALLRGHGAAAAERLTAILGNRILASAAIDLREWSVRLYGSGLEVHTRHAAPPSSRRDSILFVQPGQTVIVAPAGRDLTPDTYTVADPGTPEALATLVAGRLQAVAAAVTRAAAPDATVEFAR